MPWVEIKKKGEVVYLQQKQRKKKEGLRRVESEEEVHICELEQGVNLGQEDEDDEAMKPYVFKSNKLCVFAGYQRTNEQGHWSGCVMKRKEDEYILFQSIINKPNQIFGEEESGTTLSHSEELVMKLDSTSLD